MASGDVTWNNTQSLDITGNDVEHAASSYWCYGNSDQKVDADNDPYVEFVFNNGNGENYYVFALTDDNEPYSSSSPDPGTAGYRLTYDDSRYGTIAKWNGSSWAYAGDFDTDGYDMSTAVVRFGFDGGEFYITIDGTEEYRDTGETHSEDFMFLVVAGNDVSGTDGLNDVVYDDGIAAAAKTDNFFGAMPAI